MKPVKDAAKVDAMWRTGQPFIVDRESGYRYSMVARCPKDGNDGGVEQIFNREQVIERVVFRCTACGDKFEAAREDICVY
jgi:hypothetical protein